MPEPSPTNHPREPATRWILAAMAVALVLRLFGLSWGLPEIYEEATPLRMAWEMWGWGRSPYPDFHPPTFHYPSLTFYVHMVAQGLAYLADRVSGLAHSANDFRLLFLADPTSVYLVGRWVTVAFAPVMID